MACHLWKITMNIGLYLIGRCLWVVREVHKTYQRDTEVGLSLLCSKIYLLFLPEFPKKLFHSSFIIPVSNLFIPIIMLILVSVD